MCEGDVCGCPEMPIEAIGSPRVVTCGCELPDVGAAK